MALVVILKGMRAEISNSSSSSTGSFYWGFSQESIPLGSVLADSIHSPARHLLHWDLLPQHTSQACLVLACDTMADGGILTLLTLLLCSRTA
jgi:hypothetical protein